MTTKKKTAKTPKSQKDKKQAKKFWKRTKADFSKLNTQRQRFLQRRPHRSFRLTKRRDYRRPLNIPGYWALTSQAYKLFWRNKKAFFALIFAFSVLTVLLSSIMTQDSYQQLRDSMSDLESDGVAKIYAVFGLFLGVVTSYASGAVPSSSSAQQIIGVLLGMFAWLTSIWLVRAFSSGKKVKMRDGLYNSGGPVIALFVLVMVALIQMIPAAIFVIMYSSLSASGALDQTIFLMLAGGATTLMFVLSVYWLTSTFLAMIIITLPGMYPFKALKLSGDIVTGRRLRMILRLSWVLVFIAITWMVVLVPVILIDGAIKNLLPIIEWLPIVPVTGLFLVYLTVVLFAAYIYLFYRKVIDSDGQQKKN